MIGEVFKMRIQPKYVIACLDACEASGYDTTNMGLATAVKIGIMVLAETALRQGLIKEADPFSYSRRLQGFRQVTRYAKSIRALSEDEKFTAAAINDTNPIPSIDIDRKREEIDRAVRDKIAIMRGEEELQKGIDSVVVTTPTAEEVQAMSKRKADRARARDLQYQIEHKMRTIEELNEEETQLLVDYTNVHIVSKSGES